MSTFRRSYRPAPADIDQARATFGVSEAQVRRDFVISWMLWAIAESTPDVVFLGGTALNRTLLTNLRLSEDIDLMPTSPRSQVAAALHEGLTFHLERGFGQVIADIPLHNTRHPAASIYEVGAQKIRVQLVDHDSYQWPWHSASIHQRYQGCPPATLKTLTSEGFAAAKTTAWCERNAPRDLYDLWAMASAGLITPAAAETFRRHGPTNQRPSPAIFPAEPPNEQEWRNALSHQCIPKVSPVEAYRTVVSTWEKAR
jgi:predicted nucleotidyltransferase component of viral defense system